VVSRRSSQEVSFNNGPLPGRRVPAVSDGEGMVEWTVVSWNAAGGVGRIE